MAIVSYQHTFSPADMAEFITANHHELNRTARMLLRGRDVNDLEPQSLVSELTLRMMQKEVTLSSASKERPTTLMPLMRRVMKGLIQDAYRHQLSQKRDVRKTHSMDRVASQPVQGSAMVTVLRDLGRGLLLRDFCVVILCYSVELSIAETATMLQYSTRTIDRTLSRVRALNQ